jgi:hypothetical protein
MNIDIDQIKRTRFERGDTLVLSTNSELRSEEYVSIREQMGQFTEDKGLKFLMLPPNFEMSILSSKKKVNNVRGLR